MRDLLARRPSYPIRRMWKKLSDYREMSKELAAHFLFEEQQRLELDRVLHQAQSERYQWNQKEHDRREKYLEGQLVQAEQRLHQVDASVARLRMLGITRRTAGFLVWAGYLSFAGFGWFAGESIQSLADRDSGFLQPLLMLLARSVKALIEQFGMAPGVAILLLAPLLLLAPVFGVFFLTDRSLSRFEQERLRVPTSCIVSSLVGVEKYLRRFPSATDQYEISLVLLSDMVESCGDWGTLISFERGAAEIEKLRQVEAGVDLSRLTSMIVVQLPSRFGMTPAENQRIGSFWESFLVEQAKVPKDKLSYLSDFPVAPK